MKSDWSVHQMQVHHACCRADMVGISLGKGTMMMSVIIKHVDMAYGEACEVCCLHPSISLVAARQLSKLTSACCI